MATLSVEQVDQDGLDATYNAVAASDKFDNSSGRVIIHVKNGDASSDTVTIVTTKTLGGLDLDDATGTVPAGEERFLGPFSKGIYNDIDDLVEVQHSNTTSITMAVIKI